MGQPLAPHSGYQQDNINLFNNKRTQGKFLAFPKLPAAITIEFTKGRSAHNNRVIQYQGDTNKRKVVRRFAIDDWRLAIATSNCKSKIRNRKSCYSPCVRRVGFLICPPAFLRKQEGELNGGRGLFESYVPSKSSCGVAVLKNVSYNASRSIKRL